MQPRNATDLIPAWTSEQEHAFHAAGHVYVGDAWSRFGRRDQPQVHHRYLAITGKTREVGDGPAKRKAVTMRASTPDPVDWGGWSEVLVHREGSVDSTAAAALLVNHDPNRIAGPLSGIRMTPEGLDIDAEILPDAVMTSGISVADAVDSGALRGVSIGYWYRMEDCVWDESTRTLTVNKWRLLEASLTPIPADDSAGLRQRSAPSPSTRATAPTDKDSAMNFEQWLAKRGYTLALLSEAEATYLRALFTAKAEAAEIPAGFAPQARTAEAGSEGVRAAAIRADRERALTITRSAESHGLKASDYIDMTIPDANQAMLDAITARSAAAHKPVGQSAVVTEDQADKAMVVARASLYKIAGLKGDDAADEKLIRSTPQMNMRSLVQLILRNSGYSNADYASELELASMAQGMLDLRTFGRRDAANKVTASFSNLLANVATKQVQAGLDAYNASTWQLWATKRNVPNFLAVTNTNLAAGLLTQTAEGAAFPELTQKDGGYNSSLGVYGATISITLQTLINDQLGKVLGDLRRVGGIAAQTIDRAVYTALLGASWTNDTSATSPLTTISNLDKPRAALKTKLSPAGVKMGTVARYLLHDPAYAVPAQQATGMINTGGQVTAPSQASRQITPVESHWISDTSLAGSALTTDYYLAADGDMVDTVLVNFLEGLGMAPLIVPFDPGAVAAEKWKIMLPFQATIAPYVDSAGTTRFAGLQKATTA